MRFHPDKCKVVSIASNGNRLSYLRLLPFSRFSYALGNTILDYEKNEIDLGVTISDQFTWSEHHLKLITEASQMLKLIKRTCHFLRHSKRKRTLYLIMVRSQFEHYSIIWCPVTASGLDKFEAVQKNAIKWILNEEFTSYSDYDTYLQKCMEVNILPISKHFDLTDLCYFHKVLPRNYH